MEDPELTALRAWHLSINPEVSEEYVLSDYARIINEISCGDSPRNSTPQQKVWSATPTWSQHEGH